LAKNHNISNHKQEVYFWTRFWERVQKKSSKARKLFVFRFKVNNDVKIDHENVRSKAKCAKKILGISRILGTPKK